MGKLLIIKKQEVRENKEIKELKRIIRGLKHKLTRLQNDTWGIADEILTKEPKMPTIRKRMRYLQRRTGG